MGFFSGSSTTTVTPIPRLFDSGIFTNVGSGPFGAGEDDPNRKARELATTFQDTLLQSQFFQNPEQLNALIQQLSSGGSLLSGPLSAFITDQAQGKANPRGLGQITEAERISALAPFELQARDTFGRSLTALSASRGFDLSSLLQLAELARPDLLVGSNTKSTSSPSGIAALSSLLELGKSGSELFAGANLFGPTTVTG